MKLNVIGPNQNEIEKGNGVIVFFSYNTPVAVFIPGTGALCTDQKYSKTTSKHVNQTVERWGCSRQDVAQDVINRWAESK